MNNPNIYGYHYNLAYYRRNNFGQPCMWIAYPFDNNTIEIYHGIVGKTISRDLIHTKRNPKDEIKSRTNAKRKTGYKLLCEIKDSVSLPVEGELISFLDKYLPNNRTNAEDSLLPMLAKVYTPKIFDKNHLFFGQYKINGLRCFVSAYRADDLFNTVHLRFQSREGTNWCSLMNLEQYLLTHIPEHFINKMIEEHIILDGEIYIPNHTVNEINHFVKDPYCKENKLLQYWCYDLAIDDCTQESRNTIRNSVFSQFNIVVREKQQHICNKDRLVNLPSYIIRSDEDAVSFRNYFIDYGFEGLILRNPEAEYQYGKRNQSMLKFKAADDGIFTIIDIYPEGIKRSNIPLLLLKNDINDSTFEVHSNGSFERQEYILKHKELFIGKQVYVTFGERSGIQKVPFHVKEVTILET